MSGDICGVKSTARLQLQDITCDVCGIQTVICAVDGVVEVERYNSVFVERP